MDTIIDRSVDVSGFTEVGGLLFGPGISEGSMGLVQKTAGGIVVKQATAKRKITLTIELTPDDERRTIGVSVTAKSTLAATNPVATALYVTSDGNGELVVAEMVPQVPGQMNMDGTQQEAPKLLKLVQHG